MPEGVINDLESKQWWTKHWIEIGGLLAAIIAIWYMRRSSSGGSSPVVTYAAPQQAPSGSSGSSDSPASSGIDMQSLIDAITQAQQVQSDSLSQQMQQSDQSLAAALQQSEQDLNAQNSDAMNRALAAMQQQMDALNYQKSQSNLPSQSTAYDADIQALQNQIENLQNELQLSRGSASPGQVLDNAQQYVQSFPTTSNTPLSYGPTGSPIITGLTGNLASEYQSAVDSAGQALEQTATVLPPPADWEQTQQGGNVGEGVSGAVAQYGGSYDAYGEGTNTGEGRSTATVLQAPTIVVPRIPPSLTRGRF